MPVNQATYQLKLNDDAKHLVSVQVIFCRRRQFETRTHTVRQARGGDLRDAARVDDEPLHWAHRHGASGGRRAL